MDSEAEEHCVQVRPCVMSIMFASDYCYLHTIVSGLNLAQKNKPNKNSHLSFKHSFHKHPGELRVLQANRLTGSTGPWFFSWIYLASELLWKKMKLRLLSVCFGVFCFTLNQLCSVVMFECRWCPLVDIWRMWGIETWLLQIYLVYLLWYMVHLFPRTPQASLPVLSLWFNSIFFFGHRQPITARVEVTRPSHLSLLLLLWKLNWIPQSEFNK